MIKRENIEVKTTDLIPYVNNARTHSETQIAQIAASIREFGFTNAILINDNNTIIAGHGRLAAAQKLGMKTVPCVVLSGMSKAQVKAYVIADNKLALNAGWDEDLLSAELLELKELDFDIDLLGFDEGELADLLDNDGDAYNEDEDAVPNAPEDPVSKLGDIWILGGHRLMCGDSTDAGSVALLMDGQKADQMVIAPPYNVDYEGKTKDALKIKNDKKTDDDFRTFLTEAFACAFESMKPGAAFYIWHADFEAYNFMGAVKSCGQKIRQCLIWKKQTMVFGRKDYHCQHEPCLYGWKEGAAHLWATDRKQTTILEFDRPFKNDLHPTMKPVELIEYLIKNNTKGLDLIIDLFGGSGTTLIACEKTKRKCYMMELDPKYVDVIIQRWQDFTKQQAVHSETGQIYERP